jgi:hypothetical protein
MAEEMLSIPTARREHRDVSGRFILLAFLLVLSGVAIVGLLSWWLFPRAPHPALVPTPAPSYPSPQLQADPHQDMVRFYRQEMQRLNSLGWIDRAHGLVHVPIDQAMRAVAAAGIKDWPTPAGAGRTQ